MQLFLKILSEMANSVVFCMLSHKKISSLTLGILFLQLCKYEIVFLTLEEQSDLGPDCLQQ